MLIQYLGIGFVKMKMVKKSLQFLVKTSLRQEDTINVIGLETKITLPPNHIIDDENKL